MINTAFTGAAGLRQSLLHSNKTNKLARQRAALQLLSRTGSSKRRDSLSISSEARKFSRESIVALVDKSANVSREELSYYFEHYNDGKAILDAINFGEKVSCGYNPAFKDYGVVRFECNGSRQIIPNYAVPKMNSGSLPRIHAVNNTLVLDDKSYYAWTAPSGRRYSWAVSNGHIGWASSESLLMLGDDTNQTETNDSWEMRKAGNILSNLAQGVDLWGYKNEDVLKTCASVGFTPGFFSIDAGAGKHTYILQEFGGVIDVDKNITRWNNMNWIEVGYKEGDTFSIYGNEYTVDSSGHIHISANDTFTSTDVKFARRDI
jgi:hypothetical protein